MSQAAPIERRDALAMQLERLEASIQSAALARSEALNNVRKSVAAMKVSKQSPEAVGRAIEAIALALEVLL